MCCWCLFIKKKIKIEWKKSIFFEELFNFNKFKFSLLNIFILLIGNFSIFINLLLDEKFIYVFGIIRPFNSISGILIKPFSGFEVTSKLSKFIMMHFFLLWFMENGSRIKFKLFIIFRVLAWLGKHCWISFYHIPIGFRDTGNNSK